ncbi:NUDIX hydrolase [Streptomyces sp. NPDC001978]|uniref:NUDIX hydrolase n=1 Tax=Streptomyces sp. NPDC001978 TaxID=3364627 RepID=UPI00367FFE72
MTHPVPDGVAPVVRRFLRDGPAEGRLRDAATVLVLRDGPSGVEVFLQRRSATMASAVGHYVFPGGLVDAGDRDPDMPWAGPTPSDWALILGGTPSEAAALVCAAVRETFEECGLLLAGPTPSEVVTNTRQWSAERAALAAHQLGFADFLRGNGLLLRSDLLRAAGRWITPEWLARRYDTRFFVARLPDGQVPHNPSSESDEILWRPVHEAVDDYADGRFRLMLPTAAVLREINRESTAEGAWQATYNQGPVRFRVVPAEGGAIQVMTASPVGESLAYTIPPEP